MATTGTTTDATAAPAPWYAAYPAPKSEVVTISREEVLELLKATPLEKRDFVLVDLRRNDFEGGTIRSSLNIPAQSLPLTLSAVYTTFKAAGLRKVIFYCGSSKGRGSRAAGWLADHIAEAGDNETQSLALAGGIKGWVAAGGEYVGWMEGYEEAVWRGVGEGC
ncbi:Rhodanese-like domain-containing protein [Chaetomium tenue]|uniref:Rhodanese-like domain-containing protein n=1 Tax=Chaetomium tenue TaxID=1854479 RepID=A0ACB7PJW7_9PEZI|nr:Rhodanese-like domain-containing protein [Chaetomium globosum]